MDDKHPFFDHRRRIKNPDQEETYEEKPSVLLNLKKGKYGIELFYGQTILYIPKLIADKIGRLEIYNLAEEIFGKEVGDFYTPAEYTLSWEIMLPPIKEENFIEGDKLKISLNFVKAWNGINNDELPVLEALKLFRDKRMFNLVSKIEKEYLKHY